MPNRLAKESSPYLRQHMENPVDWYPWGEEATAAAKASGKPIFLSIGYAACHWCHVMEHESFENAEIAKLMNDSFINIKVDREERPDLDQIYMSAVQAMTGRGGWPMSVFLTHDLKPFYGGTYWPPHAGRGMPGFDQVLAGVSDAWKNRRAEITKQADQLTSHITELDLTFGEDAQPLSIEPVRGAVTGLERVFDHQHGGFGGAPKFPHAMDLRVLLRAWKRDPRAEVLKLVTLTLDKMAGGGIYDHLGGGFHRYSVDARWLVPHFEKMLYDNALLTLAYLEAFQATGDANYERVARETLDYVLREMTGDEGQFYSTQDADSEGEEGKFYIWTPAEIEAVIGAERAKTFCYVYDVSPAGNFEERNILNLPKTIPQCSQILNIDEKTLRAQLAEDRKKLLAVREKRVHPGLDDKALTSWNGMMIEAFAVASGVLHEPRYLAAATRAAEWSHTRMRRADGTLFHTFREGKSRLDGYLDDYTCLGNALVALYQAGFDERWIDFACELADTVIAQFSDHEKGGFFFTADKHEKLVMRPKDTQDGSTPSGNAMAATMLTQLGKLTGKSEYLAAARRTLGAFMPLMRRAPTAAGQMLIALDMHEGPTQEVVILGAESAREGVLNNLRARFWPNKLVAARPPASKYESKALTDLFAGKDAHAAEPVAYICENFACQAPAVGETAILAAWEKYSPTEN